MMKETKTPKKAGLSKHVTFKGCRKVYSKCLATPGDYEVTLKAILHEGNSSKKGNRTAVQSSIFGGKWRLGSFCSNVNTTSAPSKYV